MNDKSLTDDQIRKMIWDLSIRRDRIQNKLSHPPQMIEGCLHIVYKKCGSPNCKCTSGKKHGPYWVLSRKEEGKRKLIYIKKVYDVEKVKNYQNYNKDLASLRKINEKIFYWFRILRDRSTVSYEKK